MILTMIMMILITTTMITTTMTTINAVDNDHNKKMMTMTTGAR